MNYFSYFSEVEERFQRRRGSGLLLSTLDWALIETWREAGVPLPAVLRGIDAAFDKRETHPGRRKQRAVNGLAWCSQAVMEAVQQMAEAAVGAETIAVTERDAQSQRKQDGFERARVAAYLSDCEARLEAADVSSLQECATRLHELAAQSESPDTSLEEMETRLTMLEEKMFAILLAASPDEELVRIREQSSRELAPYRSKMQAAQLKQVERQFLHKRLLEAHQLPRLSLFYMPHD